jgi:hypothetical protein
MLALSDFSLEVSMKFSINFLIYLVAGASLAGGSKGDMFPKLIEGAYEFYKFPFINMGLSDREVRVLPLPPKFGNFIKTFEAASISLAASKSPRLQICFRMRFAKDG